MTSRVILSPCTMGINHPTAVSIVPHQPRPRMWSADAGTAHGGRWALAKPQGCLPLTGLGVDGIQNISPLEMSAL